MVDLVRYGSLDPIPFKITLSGVGVSGLTFAANDVQLSVDNGAAIDISAEVTEMTIGGGWYIWTPSVASRTQGELLVINIADVAGGAFDENGIIAYTGGNISTRFNGI